MNTVQILNVLIDATLAGAREVLAVRRAGLQEVEYKDARELVTIADQHADRAMREIFERDLESGIALALEESGRPDEFGDRWVGADPLDGTNHFACGGTAYSIQAHYVERGIPQAGVVFQPEVFLPLAETPECVGRLAYAVRGQGAFLRRTTCTGSDFSQSQPRPLRLNPTPATRSYAACVPISSKMSPEERSRATRVLESGLVAVTTGAGGAGANAMVTLTGGQHVYANLGAGEDLDLIPPQVIAEEAGATVWGVDRQPLKWFVRKQPFVLAVNPQVAESFLAAAGL